MSLTDLMVRPGMIMILLMLKQQWVQVVKLHGTGESEGENRVMAATELH